VSGETDREIKQ